jgi:hypothetical protein
MFFGHILKLNPYPIFRTKKRLKNWGVKKIFFPKVDKSELFKSLVFEV